jgi:large subunit ribosomal protein L20
MLFFSNVCRARLPREIVFALAKGHYGRIKGCYKLAFTKIMKHLHVEYLDRKRKSGQYQALWISRINAAAREYRLTYKNMMVGTRRANIALDRKVLCNLAETEPVTFKVLVDEAKRVKFPPPLKARDLSQF